MKKSQLVISAAWLTLLTLSQASGATNIWIRSGSDAKASTLANWSLGHSPTNGETVYLGTSSPLPDMTWDITNTVAGWLQTPQYVGTVTFPVSTTMRLNIIGDLDIQSGHMVFTGDPAAIGSGSPSVKHGVGYTIQAANITVGTNASMNADGKGFALKQGPGKGDSYFGASHGGCGGIFSMAYTQPLRYGNLAGPTALGSGGADKAGGGAIKLIATGIITIDGRVSADVPAGTNGGGAGGSIWIAGGTLRGKGRISANGGTSSNTLCQGGGGRIDISGAVNNFTGTLQANGSGGTGYRRGTTGSILLPQSSGSGPTLNRFVPVTSIAFGNAVTFGPAAIIPAGVTLTLDANDGDNVFVFDSLIVSNSGTVACLGNTLAINSAAGGTSGNRYGAGVAITVTNLAIHAGGALHADNAGFGAATGPGSSTVSTWGGSYGGRGGVSGYSTIFPVRPCYGSEFGPTALGSGGSGNVGGGAIKVTVANTATVNGRISANSTTAAQNASLGSGGSVWITGGTLAGAGVIAANGGAGGNTPSGGGGGRLDIRGGANNFSGSLQVLGGMPNSASRWACGLAGSIVLPQSAGASLTMDHFVLTNAITFGNSLTFTQPVVVTNGGTLTFESNSGHTTHRFTTLTVANGGAVVCKGNWAVTNAAAGGTAANPYGEGIVIEATQVTVQTGGSLSANGGGGFYEGGPGRKLVYAAAYGGKSGFGFNSTYGSLFNVTALGSGAKGYGGGALKLVVGGTLTVNGLVAADGALADWNGAAGSGGSLWVDCNLLQGSGTLSANGGRAANAEGGGGGRVYLVYDSLGAENPVSASKILAYGGYGWNLLDRKGGAGTVLIRPRSSPANTGTLIVKNDTVANNAVTPLPPDVVTTAGELAGVTLRIQQHGRVSLLSDLKIGDLFLTDGSASPAQLTLNGRTLKVNSYYHNDWGNAAWVVYGGGKIVWKSGMLLMVR
jgi:hypothetical protein